MKHKLDVKINSHKHENEVKLSTANLESFSATVEILLKLFQIKKFDKTIDEILLRSSDYANSQF